MLGSDGLTKERFGTLGRVLSNGRGAGDTSAWRGIDGRFETETPDTVWGGDITYVWTVEGWLYLAVLLDLCSRRIVGWSLQERLTGELTLEALNRALEARQPKPGLLHHSDRGSQYTAEAYQARLRSRGFEVSMSRRGDCWDNAPLESFFATLKKELLRGGVFPTRQQARAAIFDYIEGFYNTRRLHSGLGYRAPTEVERLMAFSTPELSRGSGHRFAHRALC